MPTNHDKKVLIVEDSRSFSSILTNIISTSGGFEVETTESLEGLHRVIDGKDGDYFVAIVDYHLPDAPNGEAIRVTVNADIPTIVFTGTANKSIEEDLWDKGIADYANKNGTYNLEYVAWMVRRIHANQSVEILIVDDSESARLSIAQLLGRQNFKTHLAASGEEALRITKQHPNINIAVIDCNMEGMSGYELATTLREKTSRAKLEIIGISAYGGRNNAAKFIKCGASDFILKPLIPEEFLSRVNTAADRIDAYNELDELNRIKNQFIGMAAHDIRGPLGSIKTAAEYILKRSPPPDREEKLLNLVFNSSTGLIELLETLLDISVIESGIPQLNAENINLSEDLNERIELYQAEAQSKNIAVDTNIESDITMLGDELKLKQVFDNLITNAIKYSEKDSEILITLGREDDRAELTVQDAGPGIPDNEKEHLFKAFSVLSTKATGGEKKTGLGLAIAKSIVDAHKGEITYTHDAQTHSTFTVALPLNQEKID